MKKDVCRGARLPADYVIHTVGPIYDAYPHEEAEQLLESCHRYCASCSVTIAGARRRWNLAILDSWAYSCATACDLPCLAAHCCRQSALEAGCVMADCTLLCAGRS